MSENSPKQTVQKILESALGSPERATDAIVTLREIKSDEATEAIGFIGSRVAKSALAALEALAEREGDKATERIGLLATNRFSILGKAAIEILAQRQSDKAATWIGMIGEKDSKLGALAINILSQRKGEEASRWIAMIGFKNKDILSDVYEVLKRRNDRQAKMDVESIRDYHKTVNKDVSGARETLVQFDKDREFMDESDIETLLLPGQSSITKANGAFNYNVAIDSGLVGYSLDFVLIEKDVSVLKKDSYRAIILAVMINQYINTKGGGFEQKQFRKLADKILYADADTLENLIDNPPDSDVTSKEAAYRYFLNQCLKEVKDDKK